MIGPEGDRFIGIEGASIDILAHFSPYAKKKLVDERASSLSIPNGSKQPLAWIYKYMRSGEAGAAGEDAFETLTFDNLVLLYTHSAFLQYQALMDKVVARLKGKYHTSLPSIDDLKTFAAFVPLMFEYAVGVLAHEMVNPWACNYTAYTQLADDNQEISDALGAAMEKLIAHRVEVGEEYYARTLNRQVAWSKEYLANVGKGGGASTKYLEPNPKKLNSVSSSPQSKSKNFKTAPAFDGSKSTLKAPLNRSAANKQAICYYCGGAGHQARNCPIKTKQESVVSEPAGTPASSKTARNAKPKAAFICYNCGEDGHMSRDCPAEQTEKTKKAQGSLVKCYNCNAQGHLSRDFTQEKKQPRFRQARVAYIEVAGNGEGLRTCDREVKKGEKTRTGLVI